MADTLYPVVLDLDGTLVDSVFEHVIAWDVALRAHGREVPMWRIHAAIGMGSERLIPWILGAHPGAEAVTAIKKEHERRFLDRADDLRPTPGALALVADLEQREVDFRIATSATGPMHEALLAALGRSDLSGVDADAVDAGKPAPDLLLVCADDLGAEPERITLVGDSPWDAEAGGRVGMRTIAVRCGGFGDDRLIAAGAIDVVDAPADLVGRL